MLTPWLPLRPLLPPRGKGCCFRQGCWPVPPSLCKSPLSHLLSFPPTPQQQLQEDVGLENWNEVTLGSWTPSQLREQHAGCYSFLPALLVEGYMFKQLSQKEIQ